MVKGNSGKGKKVLWLALLLAVLALLLAGCGGAKSAAQVAGSADRAPQMALESKAEMSDAAGDMSNAPMESPPADQDGQSRVGDVRSQRKVIKNADLSMHVENLEDFLAWVEMRVDALGGLVAESRTTGYGQAAAGEKSSPGKAFLTLRVPAEKFAAFLAELRDRGQMTDPRIYTQDVTEQYVDLEARIGNLKSQEGRLRQILGQAKNVQEILSVERELERVRGEIESLTGKFNVLQDQVEFSTITLQVSEDKPFAVELRTSGFANLGQRIANSFTSSLNGLADLAAGLMVFLAGALPVLVLLVLAAVPASRVYNKRRKPPVA